MREIGQKGEGLRARPRAGRRSVAVNFAPDLCNEKALVNQG
jgi:hypothetical protein